MTSTRHCMCVLTTLCEAPVQKQPLQQVYQLDPCRPVTPTKKHEFEVTRRVSTKQYHRNKRLGVRRRPPARTLIWHWHAHRCFGNTTHFSVSHIDLKVRKAPGSVKTSVPLTGKYADKGPNRYGKRKHRKKVFLSYVVSANGG